VSLQKTSGCFSVSEAFKPQWAFSTALPDLLKYTGGLGLGVGLHDFSKSVEKWLKNIYYSLKLATDW